jgi:hypothetical protein
MGTLWSVVVLTVYVRQVWDVDESEGSEGS